MEVSKVNIRFSRSRILINKKYKTACKCAKIKNLPYYEFRYSDFGKCKQETMHKFKVFLGRIKEI